MKPVLLDEIASVASELPFETLQRFADAKPILQGEAHDRLAEVTKRCEQHGVARDTLAFALLTAATAAERERRAERVDLVWTGPGGAEFGLRRIEPVLLGLINGAQRSLLVVTFAAYEVHDVRDAIIAAAQRGVQVCVVTEHARDQGGNIQLSPLPALIGLGAHPSLRVFHWPHDARPTIGGKTGSLHAKTAVADDHAVVISSANFTGHALAINMELGVRVTGGPLPRKVREHFDELIRKGDLQRLTP